MVAWHIGLHTATLLFCYAVRVHYSLQTNQPPSFDYKGYGYVKLEGDASLVRSEIQVTISSKYDNNTYSVGRVTNSEQMRLWNMSSRQLSDFTTNFSFSIYSDEAPYADGLAFFLADPNLPLLNNNEKIEGGGLGLVGDQVLNSTEHSFVAVEFDTFTNPWDPPFLHVGMNFNSMRSSRTAPWFTNITERKVYNCSIHYNSSTLNFSISFTGYNVSGTPIEQYLSYKVDLRDYLPERVIFGFSAATGSIFEMNTLQSWSFSSTLTTYENVIPPTAAPSPIPNIGHSPFPIPDPKPEKQIRIGLLAGLGTGVGLSLSFSVFICVLLWKRSKGKEEEFVFDLNMDDEFQNSTGPKRFSYNVLVSSTNNFAEAQKLGQGGFGGVYKGHLKELNSHVAIKRLSRESRQGIKEYATEVKIISQLRHRNLVQLIGWCHKKNALLLIYEFMPNGSLDSHLYSGKSLLTWPVRYNITLGLASALLYLHEEWEQCVLHRDIKSSNIMLDSNFNAKLGDFGLARLVDHEKGSQTTHVAGTRGYIAPEYAASGRATKESDIYSFGVVILEIASGRKPIDLEAKEDQVTIVEWVWGLHELGQLLEVADPKLCGMYDKHQMQRSIIVGLWCAHPDYSSRPTVRQVIQVLNFEAPLPILPRQMPVPIYVPPTTNATFSSVSFSCILESDSYLDTV